MANLRLNIKTETRSSITSSWMNCSVKNLVNFLHRNVLLGHLLNPETPIMSWWRYAINEVNDCFHSLVELNSAYKIWKKLQLEENALIVPWKKGFRLKARWTRVIIIFWPKVMLQIFKKSSNTYAKHLPIFCSPKAIFGYPICH